MDFLTRKISRAKWEREGGIGADAVTCDLRTAGNRLSFWRFRESGERIYESTALALTSTWEELEKIEIIRIAESELEAEGIVLQPSPGVTVVEDLKEYHVDAVELDLDRLGSVARLIAGKVRGDSASWRRFSKQQVGDMLRVAIREKRLNQESLKPKIRDALRTSTGRC